jgi:sugar phosphate isomerase/epimerase
MRGTISIQLYTVREQLAKDFEGSLNALAAIGYRWVEPFAGAYAGRSPAETQKALAAQGLRLSGSHVNIAGLREKLPEHLDYLAAVGCPHLVCSRADYSDEAEALATAEYFNEVGRKAKDRGMLFSYHNHGHEFVRYSGAYILDLLLEHTDPELVGLELDVYWAAKAGVDPAAYQEKWKDRSLLLHCKDMDGGPDKDFAAVGEGVLDFPAILNAAPKVRCFVVEQDKSADPFASAETSFRALTRLLQ